MGFYHRDKDIDRTYTLHKREPVLGVGGHAKVVRATARNGGVFAVKTLKRESNLNDNDVEEVKHLASLSHPNVVQLVEVFDTESELHLVMELLTGGELFDRIASSAGYSEVDAAGACRQMCQAVDYLHTRKTPILHMDLKPENWLYSTPDSDHLKLIDFGISVEWNRQSEDLIMAPAFTKPYAAPEVLQEKGCTEKCDIFSLGVILYILLTGHPPFEEATMYQVQVWKPFEQPQCVRLSEDARKLLRSMLEFDHTRRPSAQAILNDQWLKATKQDAEPMHPEVIIGIRASHIRQVCLNILAWSVSATDIENMRTCFKRFDTDQAEKLSLIEFRSALEESCSIHSIEASNIFASIQKEDNPGEICYTNFLAALMCERVRLHQKSLHSMWMSSSSSDGNSKGTILVKGLQTMLGNESNFDEGDVEALVQELDPSCTGEISFESFQKFISSLVTPPAANLGVADEEGQQKFLEMMVHLIDTELGVAGKATISSAPTLPVTNKENSAKDASNSF